MRLYFAAKQYNNPAPPDRLNNLWLQPRDIWAEFHDSPSIVVLRLMRSKWPIRALPGPLLVQFPHVMDFKGIYGEPRKLCADATRRLCSAIEQNSPSNPTKFILMNTVGVQNPDLQEKRTWFEQGLLTLLRYTLPPHIDNETAAEHLRQNVGKNNKHIEWCIVRPDSLIDAEVSPYEIEESPTTGILTGRPTTRSNVAHIMAELIENTELWHTWKFRMPVIMNSKESVQSIDRTSA